jgi:predicted transcriptional regulator
MNSQVADPYMTAKIIRSYVRHNAVAAGQLSDLITCVHGALGQLGKPAELEEVRTPAVPVRRSVHRDYVVCLDCGYRAKTLRRHISTRHGLSRDDYLKRWGLRRDHPLIAPTHSEQRSNAAKARGLGRKATAEISRRPPTRSKERRSRVRSPGIPVLSRLGQRRRNNR